MFYIRMYNYTIIVQKVYIVKGWMCYGKNKGCGTKVCKPPVGRT